MPKSGALVGLLDSHVRRSSGGYAAPRSIVTCSTSVADPESRMVARDLLRVALTVGFTWQVLCPPHRLLLWKIPTSNMSTLFLFFVLLLLLFPF